MTYVCKAISASYLRNYWNTKRAHARLVRNKWRNMAGKVLVQDHTRRSRGRSTSFRHRTRSSATRTADVIA